jgi:ribosomal protein L2
MPFFYNGFKSGLKLKDSYAKINHNFTGVKKYSPITNIVVSGGNATYTLSNNRFVAGEKVSVSEINGSNQFAFLEKEISSVSGNNVVFTGFAPTGTYIADSNITDGTAGMMQSASGISTVSFMCYIPTGTDVSNNVLKIGSFTVKY